MDGLIDFLYVEVIFRHKTKNWILKLWFTALLFPGWDLGLESNISPKITKYHDTPCGPLLIDV